MVKSACGIEAVYMCFNGTGIWGGETTYTHHAWRVHESMHVWEIEKPQIHHQGYIEQKTSFIQQKDTHALM